jgi:hypothetical protein
LQQWTFSTTHCIEEEDDEIEYEELGMEEECTQSDGDDSYDESDVMTQAEEEPAEGITVPKTVKCTARCKNGCMACKCRRAGEVCDSKCNCSGCKNRIDSPQIQTAREQWTSGSHPFTVPPPPSNVGPKKTPSSVLDAFATVFPEEMWDHLVADTQAYYDGQPITKQKPPRWTCSTYSINFITQY